MILVMQLLKAMLGMAVILGAWLTVQRLFCATSAGDGADQDALAGRMDCHACNCKTPCDDKQRARTAPTPRDADSK